MRLEPRLIADRYRLDDRIGSGGMGVVWRAHDMRLNRTVAVKQLLLGPGLSHDAAEESRARAMREARIAARLQHPHAINVFDVALGPDVEGGEDSQPWLVMEYLPSRSLGEVLAERGSLPPLRVAHIGRQIADALAAAHRKGIVHRDVKPGNVLLGDNGEVKITDFGIARATWDPTVTRTGVLTGTPAYFAPEVARGEAPDPASDVFSLGATLYAAVEGVPPFGNEDNTLALLRLIGEGEVRPPQHAGPLTPLLVQLLRLDPNQRPMMTVTRDMLARIVKKGEQTPTTSTLPRVHTGRPPVTIQRPAAAIEAPAKPLAEVPAEPAPAAIPEPPIEAEAVAAAAHPVPPATLRPPDEPPDGAPAPELEASAPEPPVKAEVAAPEPVPPAIPEPPVKAEAAAPDGVPAPDPVPPATPEPEIEPQAAAAGFGPPPATLVESESYAGDDGTYAGYPETDGRPRHRRKVLAGAVVLLLLIIGVGVLLLENNPGGADDPSTGAAEQSSAAPLSSTVAPTTASTTTTTTTTPAVPTSPAAPIAPGAAAYEQTIRDYYGLLPSDLDAAYAYLGPDVIEQANGRDGFERFWSQYSEVEAENVHASGTVVTATLVYTEQNGSVFRELYEFDMGTAEDGRILILTSQFVAPG